MQEKFSIFLQHIENREEKVRKLLFLVLASLLVGGPTPVFGSAAGGLLEQVDREELVTAIRQYDQNKEVSLRQLSSAPSDWGKVGQHTSVVGWSSSLSYELSGVKADFSLHIYAARNEKPANELFVQVIGELEENSAAGLVFCLTPEMAYGVESSCQVVVLFKDDQVTASVMRWVPFGKNLVMVEVTMSEQTEEALPDPEEFDRILVPVVKLLTEKLLWDPSAQLV